MLLGKRSIAEADLETFGAELTKRHTSIVNYRYPEGLARDGIKEKFYKAASSIQKAYPEEFIYCGELIEELGKVLKTIRETHAQSWEQMTTQLNEIIILEQQTHIKEYKEKMEQYEAMRVALERSTQNCSEWKAIALGRKR